MKNDILNTTIIDIEPGSTLFDNSILKLNQYLLSNRITFFTGAGVSKPSGLPLANELCEGILNSMINSLKITKICNSDELILIKQILKNYRLERLLDSLVDSYTDKGILEYLNILQKANENYNHESIAKFAKQGHINHIITLNFDILFEQALIKQQVPFSWYLPLVSSSRISVSDNEFTIIKPHGTLPLNDFPYAQHYLSATLQYAGDRPQLENIEAFNSILSKNPILFVAGYSDNDWDISPILSKIPWAHVFWCQFELKNEFSPSILEWLESRPSESTTLYVGDVRKIFACLLNEKKSEINETIKTPDSSIFLQKPIATALAAVTLLDGTSNELYCKLLPQFEKLISQKTDKLLYAKWKRAMAWYFHAHIRDIRQAIKINLELSEKTHIIKAEDKLNEIKKLKSIYYEYLSAAKRPHLNLRWPIDILIAMYYRSVIKQKARKINKSELINPWIIKETIKQVAFTDYYIIDLYHNWGYYLIPFRNVVIRKITQLVFKSVFNRYKRLANNYPVLNWEYHYVRSIEAALIAKIKLQAKTIQKKLDSILEMFIATDQHGHADYVRAIYAVIEKSENDFNEIEERFFNNSSGTSPTAKLRMILFRNYFWPDSRNISVYKLLKSLNSYTKKTI